MFSESQFPYMWYAHTAAVRSPFCLSQSGMPAPDPAVLGPPRPIDLGPPTMEALPELERRLATLFGVDPGRVLVTLGASMAMALAARRWFPGAQVVTELPSYEAFRALAAHFADRFEVVTRRAEDDWQLDLDAVTACPAYVRGPTHLYLCTPHNPTGAVTAPADLVRLAELAAERGGVLLSNEVYMEFAPPAERAHAFALAPNAVSIGSLTKAYGLGSLRVGWMILGEGLRAEKERLTDLTYLAYVDPPTVALRAASAALDNLPGLLAPLRALERTSRPLLTRWLQDCEMVSGRVGRYGLHAFPRVLGIDDTTGLAEYLAREHGVDAVPGEFFGCPGYLRIGWGVPAATLEQALVRLEQGIRAYN